MKSPPRYLPIVTAFAGDSTIKSFLLIVSYSFLLPSKKMANILPKNQTINP